MGYPIRQYLPDVTYEITVRTLQGRFLLRPSDEVRETILGILGRALVLYPGVRLHAFIFMSNHYHAHATPSDGDEFALFLAYVNGNIAKRVGALHGWEGRFWHRRASVVPILDELAVGQRLKYLLLNGVKEGLVSSPREWPGASSISGLLGDLRIPTKWIDWDRRRRDRHRGATSPRSDHRYVITLSPYPLWTHLDLEVQRSRCASLVKEVEAEGRSPARSVGAGRLQRQHPHAKPRRAAKKTPPPDCHASVPALRATFRSAYRDFVAVFRKVTETLNKQGSVATRSFPCGSFPRPCWFRRAEPAERRPDGWLASPLILPPKSERHDWTSPAIG